MKKFFTAALLTLPLIASAEQVDYTDLTQQAFDEMNRVQQCSHLSNLYQDLIDARFIDHTDYRAFSVTVMATLAVNPEQAIVRSWLFDNLDLLVEDVYHGGRQKVEQAGAAYDRGEDSSYAALRGLAAIEWAEECQTKR